MKPFQRIESATKHAVILRNYQRARARALTRLANNYPDQYTMYLKEEQHNDKVQGKAWININGDTATSVDSYAADTDQDRHTQATYTEDEGDL